MLGTRLETGETDQRSMKPFMGIRTTTPALRRDLQLPLTLLKKKRIGKRGKGIHDLYQYLGFR
jgi:hypothetical protein